MGTRFNQFGEIVDPANCPECHKPLKEEWVACPHCGTPLGPTAESNSSGSSARRGVSPGHATASITPTGRRASLGELESWAYSSEGFDHNRENAESWARAQLPFFENHDFALFRRLRDWAYSPDGFDYNRENAASWARAQLPFFEDHDFALFKRLRDWAYSPDGFDYNRENAASWARAQLPFFEDQDFALFKRLRDWAYSPDGLNHNRENAANWALTAVRQANGGADVEEIKERAKAQRSSGGCFISTAITSCLGLPDDCRELNALRRFRDTCMARSPEGRLEVERYYQIAPRIVESISQHPDAAGIWRSLWTSHLGPAIAAIEHGDHDRAYGIYRNMVLSLERFLEPVNVERP